MSDIANMSVEEICEEAETLWNDPDEDKKTKAVKLFRAAYSKGSYSTAGYRLGCAYYLGQGAPKELGEALTYFSNPALKNNPYALYFKGLILSDDDFAAHDDMQARNALEKAKKLGVDLAGEALEKLPEQVDRHDDETFDSTRCSICGSELPTAEDDNQSCSSCGAVSRTRTLPVLLSENIRPLMEHYKGKQAELLAFGMDAPEEMAISKYFDKFVSASLFGNYRPDHIEGVDVRDLSRFKDGNFKAVCGMVVFDYFIEMKQALSECSRVLDKGGIFFTNIIAYRLLDDESAPVIDYKIEKKPGYYDYVPEGIDLLSAKVSRGWFIKTMQEVGFTAQHRQILDPHTGEKTDWFFGVKCDKCCNLCGYSMADLDDKEINCPDCHSAPRTRCLPELLEKYITPTINSHPDKNRPLLAFAMNGPEENVLSPLFNSIKSVSLYGNYRAGHEEGVDARDLSRYDEGSFIGAMGILVFDYFVEVEKALQ